MYKLSQEIAWKDQVSKDLLGKFYSHLSKLKIQSLLDLCLSNIMIKSVHKLGLVGLPTNLLAIGGT